jgi:hypothetical protein
VNSAFVAHFVLTLLYKLSGKATGRQSFEVLDEESGNEDTIEVVQYPQTK